MSLAGVRKNPRQSHQDAASSGLVRSSRAGDGIRPGPPRGGGRGRGREGGGSRRGVEDGEPGLRVSAPGRREPQQGGPARSLFLEADDSPTMTNASGGREPWSTRAPGPENGGEDSSQVHTPAPRPDPCRAGLPRARVRLSWQCARWADGGAGEGGRNQPLDGLASSHWEGLRLPQG